MSIDRPHYGGMKEQLLRAADEREALLALAAALAAVVKAARKVLPITEAYVEEYGPSPGRAGAEESAAINTLEAALAALDARNP